MSKIEQALGGIKRRFIGEFRSNKTRQSESKYMPHQGAREIERRKRQAAKKAGE